jgi:hypothetical protein
VFLWFVVKMSDRILKQRINITHRVKSGKNASDTCAMLYAMKKSHILSDINGSKRAHMSKSQMMTKFLSLGA